MANWCTVVPVSPFYLDKNKVFSKGVKLGKGIHLDRVPDWVKSKDITEPMSFYQRKQVIEAARLAFISEYEAESLGEPDVEWRGDIPRGKQDVVLDRIALATLALWLAKPSSLRGELYIHANQTDGTWVLRETATLQILMPHEDDKSNQITKDDLRIAKRLFATMMNLDRSGTSWTACRTVWTALISAEWEIRFLLFWIALEALFGTSRGIGYRLSQRIAFFNARSRREAESLFKKAQTGYGWRNKVVHGLQLHKLRREASAQVLYETENLVRRSLTRLLRSSHITSRFNSKDRETYLDGLTFSV